MINYIRETFASSVIRETLRAFAVFCLLVMALLAIVGELAFRELSLNVLRERIDLGRTAALEIAQEVWRLGRDGDVIDYRRLRRKPNELERLIGAQMEARQFIRHVEIRDRFGVRIAFVGSDLPALPEETPVGGWPALERKIIQVPLRRVGPRREGQVLLGISPQALEQELVDVRRSLWIKIGVAGLLALGVLLLGLLYVLHLIRKNRDLERSRQAAERASYVGLLASGLAHEIRNPLNAMNMNLQMLEEELPETPSGDSAELLDSTKREIKRLEKLVTNFLTYARPPRPRLEPADPNEIVRDVVRLLEADFRQHSVRLVADLGPRLPEVEIDESQFKQALLNLLVNARQVLRDGGQVVVRTRASSRGGVAIEVSDDGPGITAETRERIFEVFYSSRGGGTGLGLPIARQIVEGHGGTIEVEPQSGRGATFRIRLPGSRSAA